jgi:two-component system OmpR family response regulator
MGKTILIAEDDKEFLRILSAYFGKSGFTVYRAETCEEAVRLARELLPDCFLLDYQLADGNAAPVCVFLRGYEPLRRAPIVILSGHTERSAECYDFCQADVFIEKGRSLEEIGAAINRHLGRAAGTWNVHSNSDLGLDAAALAVLKDGKIAARLSPEQFRFMTLLLGKAPSFVSGEELCSYVFSTPPEDCRKALSSLVYRLREKLGPWLSRRIKCTRHRGWIYVQPRVRGERPSVRAS